MSRIVACTIVSNNYLSFARVFARSFLERHPSGEVHVLIVDRPEPRFDYDAEPFAVTFAHDLGIPAFENFAFRYSILELNTAVKPFFLEHLHTQAGCSSVCYFDPDILVTGDLGDLYRLLEGADLVLTPHILRPVTDEKNPSERDFLLSGVYNLGFLGLSFNDDTRDFLKWWQAKLHRSCLHQVERGLFVDQRWMDLAPSFLSRVEILRDPGYNVAYWNLIHRRLRRDGDAWSAGGVSMRFFHFSGFDPFRPEEVSKFQDRFSLANRPEVAPLFEHYRERLMDAGFEELSEIPYGYGRFRNGVKIPPAARRSLQRRDPEGRRWRDPFDAGDAGGFYGWLREPLALDEALSLPRIALEIWEERRDLRQSFPRPRQEDLVDFALWFTKNGWREERLAEVFVTAARESLSRAEDQHRDLVEGRLTHFSNGVEIPPRARQVLAEADPDGRRWLFPAADEPRGFQRWLAEPDDPAAAILLPRIAFLIWEDRPDLRESFPSPDREDRRAFAGWFVRFGGREEELAAAFVEPTRASLRAELEERFAALVPDARELASRGEAPASLDPEDAAYLAADGTHEFGEPDAAYAPPCVPRLALLIFSSRDDLRGAYPDPLGASRAAFAYWYVTDGRREYGLAPGLMTHVLRTLPRRQRLSALLRRWRSGLGAALSRPAPAPPSLETGAAAAEAAPPNPVIEENEAASGGTDLAAVHDTWELLARSDPLWAILSSADKMQGRWDLQEFFDTGRDEIASMLEHLVELGVELDRSAALDFGCGAGRLTRALARRFGRAVGIDISETMVRLARHYSREDNATYLVNRREDLNVFADNSFSFIYTGRVLQHIRPSVSRRYIREFFRVLAPGGLAVFQVPSGERGKSAGESALPAQACRAALEVEGPPASLAPGQSAVLTVEVTNTSRHGWPPVAELGVYQIRLGNRWLDTEGRTIIPDQGRTALEQALAPGQSRRLELIVWPPNEPGRYLCRLDLVQEHIAWFGSKGSIPLDLEVEVVEVAGAQAGSRPRQEGSDHSGHADIEMHTLPRGEVVRLIEESGGEVLEIKEDDLAGPEWNSLTYCGRKARSFRPYMCQHPAAAARAGERQRPPRRGWSYLTRKDGETPPLLNRFVQDLWLANPYFQDNFPLTSAEGRADFLRWIRHNNKGNLEIQSWLLPDAGDEIAVPGAVGDFAAGVNVIDHPSATLGIREDARTTVLALEATGVPHTVADVFNTESDERKAQGSFLHRVNIFHINADQMSLTFGRMGPQVFESRFNIGYWLWELPQFPAYWTPSFDLVDEVWVPSRHVYEALARVAPVPVVHLPYPVVAEPDASLSRSDFFLPSKTFLFLFSFDAKSYMARKNPMASIQAFQKAFKKSERHVGLVLKAANLSPAAPAWDEIRQAAEEDPRILVLDQYLPRDSVLALVGQCDAYLSLHRAEGFGRGPAEAMLLGKPVVVTGYSGCEEYCTPETACRVDYRLVPVGEGEYPFPQGQVWAEPDIEHAAWHLRRLVGDEALRGRLSEAGRRFVSATYNSTVVGLRYRKRLESLGLL